MSVDDIKLELKRLHDEHQASLSQTGVSEHSDEIEELEDELVFIVGQDNGDEDDEDEDDEDEDEDDDIEIEEEIDIEELKNK